jgi:hypothetical protein
MNTEVAYEPVPTLLVAATRKMYVVPFVKPVTVADVAVEVPSANVVQFVASVEY